MSSWHTVIAAIKMSVAMAYSGVVDWVNWIHGKWFEIETCRVRTVIVPGSTSDMILVEDEDMW